MFSYGLIRDQEERQEKDDYHTEMIKSLGQMMGAKKIGG